MIGWFELESSPRSGFHFVLKARNGEVVLASEHYTSKPAALDGIASVRANCGVEARYRRHVASDGRFYFTLEAANHQVIGTSQLYASQSSRDAGIISVQANGTSDTVQTP